MSPIRRWWRNFDALDAMITVFAVSLLAVLSVACFCGAVGLLRWTFG